MVSKLSLKVASRFQNELKQSIIFIRYILIESKVFQRFRATLSLSKSCASESNNG